MRGLNNFVNRSEKSSGIHESLFEMFKFINALI